jgi:hypothetical protein
MRRLKFGGLILAGMLAITPAAFALPPGQPTPPALRGFGGGGGFHGSVGHFRAGSDFSRNYAWRGGNYAHYRHGGYWYGGRYYYGGYWSGYPYDYGDYDGNYDGYPDYYADSHTTVIVTTPSDSEVVAVQKKLAQLGYYQGPIDGIDGPETQKAIRWFQSTDKIAVTGQINEQTLKALQIS